MVSLGAESVVLEIALWAAGGVVVPMDESLSVEVLRKLVRTAGVVAVVVDDDERAVRIRNAQGGRYDDPLPPVLTLQSGWIDRLLAAAEQVPPLAESARRWELRPDHPAAISYAIAEDGELQGAMLTHGQIAAQAGALALALQRELHPSDSLESPARLLVGGSMSDVATHATVIAALSSSTTIAFWSGRSARDLVVAAKGFHPTVLAAPAMSLEEVVRLPALKSSRIRSSRRARRASRATYHPAAVDEGARIGASQRPREFIVRHLLKRRWRRLTGGRLRAVVFGDDASHGELGAILRRAGLDALQGYAVAEAAGLLAINRPGHARAGSVGRALPGSSVRITSEGEIEIAGPGVFAGYDGRGSRHGDWFGTGDHGWLDPGGYLHLLDRRLDWAADGRR